MLEISSAVLAPSKSLEANMGCVAAVAAMAVLRKGVYLSGVPVESAQGDAKIFSILQQMGADIRRAGLTGATQTLQIFPSLLVGTELDLNSSPDLFPILAALASRAIGVSTFTGLQDSNDKESRRTGRVCELLTSMGAKCEIFYDKSDVGVRITPASIWPMSRLKLSPDSDHRLVMAAAIMKLMGAPIEITDPQIVAKIFPKFWEFHDLFAT